MPVLERLLFAIAGIAIMAGLLASYVYERNMTDRIRLNATVGVPVALPPRDGAAKGEDCRHAGALTPTLGGAGGRVGGRP
jgi:hypothetical protein